jgi:hypothetical protein
MGVTGFFKFLLNIGFNCIGLLKTVGSKLPSKSPEKVIEYSNSGEAVAGKDGVKYSYTDFSVVDHRVKLHLYLHVFQQEKEELVFLLRVSTCHVPRRVCCVK